MLTQGEIYFKRDIENFVLRRLRLSYDKCLKYEDSLPNVEKRLEKIKSDLSKEKYYNRSLNNIHFLPLTNHRVCHEMFWNAFRGRSRMYIQMRDIRFDDDLFDTEFGCVYKTDMNKEQIMLECSMITLQMLDYDAFMFKAMEDGIDKEYKRAARKFYRPYLFSYVAKINFDQYKDIQRLQKEIFKHKKISEQFSYLWMPCTFDVDSNKPFVEIDGYVLQSASAQDNTFIPLALIGDEQFSCETIEEYNFSGGCLREDDDFIRLLEMKLNNHCLQRIDAYKVGNGNCIYAQCDDTKSFFFDVGYQRWPRFRKSLDAEAVPYSESMKKIKEQKPSFIILSHWDMDHLAGSYVMEVFEKDWFAPDCYDACMNAKRIAKYLDITGHLILAKRKDEHGSMVCGRLIGGQIDIKSKVRSCNVLGTYKFYMGQKDRCDSNRRNCEGIVIEYTDLINEKNVLMMGDVNYASFNKALSNDKKGASFSNMHIDYLIVPHHGSINTKYHLITANNQIIKEGRVAIICCIDQSQENRPNSEHKAELEKRFVEGVFTTEHCQEESAHEAVKISIEL